MGSDTLHQHFPALLIGLSVLILFMPFRIFYHESRMCLLNSLVSIDSDHDGELRNANQALVACGPGWDVSCRMVGHLRSRHALLTHV